MAGDEASGLRETAAPGDTADDHAVRDRRSGRVAETLRLVGLLRLPHEITGPRIDGDHRQVGRGHEDLVLVERDGAHQVGPAPLGILAAVLPDDVAGPRVERLQDVSRIGQVHHAVMDQRRRLHASRFHRPHPGEPQLVDVVRCQLVERAVAVAVRRPPPRQPLLAWRIREQLIGHLAKRLNLAIHERDRTGTRCAKLPVGRLHVAVAVARGVGIDEHGRIGAERLRPLDVPVGLQDIGDDVQIGCVAEGGFGARRHGAPDVLEQCARGPGAPDVSKVWTDQRRPEPATQVVEMTLSTALVVGGAARGDLSLRIRPADGRLDRSGERDGRYGEAQKA